VKIGSWVIAVVALAGLDHCRRRQILWVVAHLHPDRSGSGVEVRCSFAVSKRAVVLHRRRVQTVGANVGVVDSCAHGDRLIEVRVLAKHCTKLESLIVMCVLFATGSGSCVDLLGSNTRQIRDH